MLMKKFILCILCAIAVIPAFAQLNVKSQNERVETVGSLRSGYASLKKQGTMYFLGIRSSNQFDDDAVFVLGKTAESAALTAGDLVGLCDSLKNGESVDVQDALGQNALIMKKSMFGAPYLDIKTERNAGTSNITKPELQKAVQLIKEDSGME